MREANTENIERIESCDSSTSYYGLTNTEEFDYAVQLEQLAAIAIITVIDNRGQDSNLINSGGDLFIICNIAEFLNIGILGA